MFTEQHFCSDDVCVFRMEIGEEPLVKTAATLFQRLCYNYRDKVMAGIIVAGWDRKVGPQVMLMCFHSSLHTYIIRLCVLLCWQMYLCLFTLLIIYG